MNVKNVCVVGLGYMGLPTALLIAKTGLKVVGYDIVKSKVDMINKGILPFEEKGMPELFNAGKKNLTAISKLSKEELKDVNFYIISVPTPFTPQKTCDLKYVISATEAIAPFLKKGDTVVLESTVSPRTTTDVVKPILERSGLIFGKDFSLSYASEKAIPGNTLYEMVNNARIIGGLDDKSKERTKEVYSVFVKGPIYLTDPTIAEMTKLVENTYRDINIAFANDLLKICESYGVNVWDVINFANKHPRVNVHFPGPGVGGHCIAIDPWFLTEKTPSNLIKTARLINDGMPNYVFLKINKLIAKKKITNPKIGILGLAYKKNVDDDRESPSEYIIDLCVKKGFTVFIHDPLVKNSKYQTIKNVDEVLKKSDIVVITTDHDIYLKCDFSKSVVLDTRNMNIKAKEHYIMGAEK
jgi:UDP-N-acetyl-D-mannosaminuronic acid dehydrogenase